jgi:hypothetical protein
MKAIRPIPATGQVYVVPGVSSEIETRDHATLPRREHSRQR